MDLSQETQEKISQLQLFEQKLHAFLSQRQSFQNQVLEIENALEELHKTQGPAYKIIGSVMLKMEKDSLSNTLKERLDLLSIRIKNIQKQEDSIKKEAEEIQKEVMAEIEQKGKKNHAGTH